MAIIANCFKMTSIFSNMKETFFFDRFENHTQL